jgi:DNA-binding NarL/FixJ family response regulator
MVAHAIATCRVLVVDDDQRIRSALPRLIASWPGYEVVGTRDSAEDLALSVVRLRPDVVLLDLDMPGRSPLHAIEDLGYRGKPAKVLVLSALGDAPSVRASLDAGAEGYVLKDDGPEALREGLEAVLMGGRYLSRGLAGVVDERERLPRH